MPQNQRYTNKVKRTTPSRRSSTQEQPTRPTVQQVRDLCARYGYMLHEESPAKDLRCCFHVSKCPHPLRFLAIGKLSNKVHPACEDKIGTTGAYTYIPLSLERLEYYLRVGALR